MKDALVEGAKEMLRVALIGLTATVIPVALSGINTATGVINFNTALLSAGFLFVGITAIAKGVDKFLHEWGKESGNDSLIKGLTRF